MKKIIHLLVFVLLATSIKSQTVPEILWSKCYGGSEQDQLLDFKSTQDGGLIVTGYSYISGRARDVMIMKTDPWGDTSWVKYYGSSSDEYANSVISLNGSGFLVAGLTTNTLLNDYNGGDSDAWIIKLDVNGDTLWTRCLGGSNRDEAISLVSTNSGEIIIVGETSSTDGDIQGSHGNIDVFIIKMDDKGNILSSNCFGGTSADRIESITAASDGGYILAGSSNSSDGDLSGNYGGSDAWALKIDKNGNLLWNKHLGGTHGDYFLSASSTLDGKYIFTGMTGSNNYDVHGNHTTNGFRDVWVVKLDTNGDTIWTRCFGGTNNDWAYSVIPTSEKEYIVAGVTESTDGDVHDKNGSNDGWVVKFKENGDTIWTRCLGGSSLDRIHNVELCPDGQVILGGYTESTNGHITSNNGSSDAWIIKLRIDNRVTTELFGSYMAETGYSVSTTTDGNNIISATYPRLSGPDAWILKVTNKLDTIWTKKYGGDGREEAREIINSDDGGYIFVGYADSTDGDVLGWHEGYNLGRTKDFWIVKIDSSGNILWSRCLGGSGEDVANSIISTIDGNYVITGYTNSTDGDVHGFNGGNNDVWVVKISTDGDTLWTKCLGGAGQDADNYTREPSLVSTGDSGVLISSSSVTYSWVSKLDKDGNELWTRTYAPRSVLSIAASSGGNYIIAGSTTSTNDEIDNPKGFVDAWAAKINENGDVLWMKGYGGTMDDLVYSVKSSPDGGYIMVGETNSNDIDIHGNHGGRDAMLLKIDEEGNLLWSKCIGGDDYDYANDICIMSDESYLLVGSTLSNNGDFDNNNGFYDLWIAKISPPVITYQNSPYQYLCSGGSADITIQATGIPPLKYQWQKEGVDILGENFSTIKLNDVTKDDYGIYRCVVMNTLMEADTSLEIEFPVIPSSSIDLVTIDQIERKNEIIINPSQGENIISYNIFKETFNNKYGLIGNVHKDSLLSFVDFSSVPQYATKKYKVAVVDTCGFEGDLSPYHQDIFTNYTFEPKRNILQWEQYVEESNDFEPDMFYIFRGLDSRNLLLYDSVDISYDFYVDNHVSDSIFYYYRVAVRRCDSSGERYAYSNINECKIPEVAFSVESPCYPDTTKLINNSTNHIYANTKYEWDVENDGSTDYQTKNASHIYPSGGEFTIKLRATNAWCSDELEKAIHVYKTPNISMTPAHDTTLCQNTLVDVTANITNYDPDNSYDYFWSNGSYLPEITVSETGKYHVTVANGNCISKDSSGYIDFIEPFAGAEICLVSVDEETGYNKIMWERNMQKGIEYYNVYKVVGNNYTPVGSVPFGEMSMFIDYYSNPDQVAARYAISTVDTCGNESAKSPFHQTIHLGASEGAAPGTYVLDWTDYIDESGAFTPEFYYIYRGMSEDALTVYDSVSGIFTEWNDTDPQGHRYYRVAIEKETGCTPSDATKANAGPFSQSISNLEDNRLKENSINNTFAENGFAVYPNPAGEKTYIRFSLARASHVDISLYSVAGKVITHILNKNIPAGNHTIEYLLDNVQAGMYYIKMATQRGVFTKKLVVQ